MGGGGFGLLFGCYLVGHTEQDHGQGDKVELSKVGLLVPWLAVTWQRGQFFNGAAHGEEW